MQPRRRADEAAGRALPRDGLGMRASLAIAAFVAVLPSQLAVGGAVLIDGLAGAALYFKPCSAGHAEAWQLAPSTEPRGFVVLQSKATRRCVVTGAAPLTTAPCNATDMAQLFQWNATAKNGLPKGETGFVRAASATLACTDKGGHGSSGCCITNNGAAGAVMYGCCPSGPSDCGNQVLQLRKDGTIRGARNPSDCLQHAAAPPPAPPAPPIPPQSSVPDPFEKLGEQRKTDGRCWADR